MVNQAQGGRRRRPCCHYNPPPGSGSTLTPSPFSYFPLWNICLASKSSLLGIELTAVHAWCLSDLCEGTAPLGHRLPLLYSIFCNNHCQDIMPGTSSASLVTVQLILGYKLRAQSKVLLWLAQVPCSGWRESCKNAIKHCYRDLGECGEGEEKIGGWQSEARRGWWCSWRQTRNGTIIQHFCWILSPGPIADSMYLYHLLGWPTTTQNVPWMQLF